MRPAAWFVSLISLTDQGLSRHSLFYVSSIKITKTRIVNEYQANAHKCFLPRLDTVKKKKKRLVKNPNLFSSLTLQVTEYYPYASQRFNLHHPLNYISLLRVMW